MRRTACLLITLLVCATMFLCTGCAKPYVPPGQKLPDGFMINCYPNSVCTRADSTPLPDKKNQQIVVLMSDDDVPKIVAWYKTELLTKGFMVLSDQNVKGSVTLESQSDTNHVSITSSPIDKKSIISISVFPKPR